MVAYTGGNTEVSNPGASQEKERNPRSDQVSETMPGTILLARLSPGRDVLVCHVHGMPEEEITTSTAQS